MQESITNPAFQYYFSALPQPVLIDTRLKDRDRRLLAAFYLIAGRGNVVYNKTRKELGRLAGMAEDVVSRISTRLVKFGWLKKSGDGGRSQSAVYELIVPDQFTHLQRSINQKCSTNTTQQPYALVVPQKMSVTQKTGGLREKPPVLPVVSLPSQNKSYSLSPSLAYPNGLDASFAHSLLIQLPETQQQVALDEWLGQITSYRERGIAIHSPNGLFRSIIKALLAGHPAQHAASVKQRRERAKLIAKAIEQPSSRENEVMKQSNSSTKRFAPGELKAKLMEEVLKLKTTKQSPNPAIAPQKTLYAKSGLSKENPVHLVQGQIITQPTKNIKTTTTVANEAVQEKVGEVPESCGGSDLKHTPDNSPTFSLPTKQTHEGVGSLSDHQTQPCTLLAKLTSAHEFVDEPSAQGIGRGQSLVGDSPPHPLSPTSFTRPDALRLPKQINIFSKPNKSDYAQEAPNDTQHGNVSSDTDARTDQKMPAERDGNQRPTGYSDLPHNQRTGHADQTGNRTKDTLDQRLPKIFLTLFKPNAISKTIKKWCRHGSRRKN